LGRDPRRSAAGRRTLDCDADLVPLRQTRRIPNEQHQHRRDDRSPGGRGRRSTRAGRNRNRPEEDPQEARQQESQAVPLPQQEGHRRTGRVRRRVLRAMLGHPVRPADGFRAVQRFHRDPQPAGLHVKPRGRGHQARQEGCRRGHPRGRGAGAGPDHHGPIRPAARGPLPSRRVRQGPRQGGVGGPVQRQLNLTHLALGSSLFPGHRCITKFG